MANTAVLLTLMKLSINDLAQQQEDDGGFNRPMSVIGLKNKFHFTEIAEISDKKPEESPLTVSALSF